jgi:hypothetical protein
MPTFSALVAFLGLFGGPSATPEPQPRWVPVEGDGYDDVGLLVADPCGGAGPCLSERQVFVDYGALGIEGMAGGEWISYDYDEVTRPVTAQELPDESEISLAVRLIVSEVGADRLLVNRYALLESIGILYSVDNRLDRKVANPQDRAEAPDFPGCGEGGTFGSCANPQQYLGMATWRALNPTLRYDDAVLEEAVDVAVLAWWLQEHGYVGDFTEGATNYVHRCGGAAYGMTTWHCDAHVGNTRRDDVPGANPFTGPIVFKAPTVYQDGRGFYGLYESRRLEYDPWWDLEVVESDDALADADPEADGAWDLVPDAVTARLRVPSFVKPDPMAADHVMGTIVSVLGAPADPHVVDRLLRWRKGNF